MSQFIKIEISDDAYRAAARLAQLTGQSVEQWAAGRLASSLPLRNGNGDRNGTHPVPLSAELAAFAGCVDIAQEQWSHNESIDRDLAVEYGSTHEDES